MQYDICNIIWLYNTYNDTDVMIQYIIIYWVTVSKVVLCDFF